MQILYVISDTMITDRFLDVFFLLLALILSEFHEKPRRKNRVTEKSTKKNLCEEHHFFGCMSSFLYHMSFLSLISSTPILQRKKKLLQKRMERRGWHWSLMKFTANFGIYNTRKKQTRNFINTSHDEQHVRWWRKQKLILA